MNTCLRGNRMLHSADLRMKRTLHKLSDPAKRMYFTLVAGCLLAGVAQALTINPTYDSSVTSLSGPVTNAAAVEGAFAAAAQTFENQYTNAVTIDITVYWGATGPFSSGINLGASQTELTGAISYADLTNALFAARTSAADIGAPRQPAGERSHRKRHVGGPERRR